MAAKIIIFFTKYLSFNKKGNLVKPSFSKVPLIAWSTHLNSSLIDFVKLFGVRFLNKVIRGKIIGARWLLRALFKNKVFAMIIS